MPICAPIASAGIYSSGSDLSKSIWQLRGVEVELAIRLGRDLEDPSFLHDPAQRFAVVDAVLPVVKVVEMGL